MQQVHILWTHFFKVILSFDAHGLYLYPLSVFPIGAGSGNFTEIDFRIEIGCKRIAMVPAGG